MPSFKHNYTVPQLLVQTLQASELQRILLSHLEPAVTRVFDEMVDTAKAYAPEGATGDLKRGIHHEVHRGAPMDEAMLRGELMSDSPYTTYVEEGTRPHMPPVDALRPWAQKVLGDADLAWPVALKIAREGTKGQFFLKRTLDELMPVLSRDVLSAIEQAISDIKRQVQS